MATVEHDVSTKKTPHQACPHSLLTKYNLTLPAGFLTRKFRRETAATRHLARLLNGFLTTHRQNNNKNNNKNGNNFINNNDDNAGLLEALDPVARSAAALLLETERRLAGTHLCWFTDELTRRKDDDEEKRNLDRLLPPQGSGMSTSGCRYFFFTSARKSAAISGSSGGVMKVGQDGVQQSGSPLRQQQPPGMGTQIALQSIQDSRKTTLPLLREVWRDLMTVATNGSLPLEEDESANAAWTAPYYDCNRTWMVTYVVGLNAREDSQVQPGERGVRGVFAVDIPLEQHVDVNQCADDDLFAFTNKCKHRTTTCFNISGGGFRKGSYNCVCRPGFYLKGGVNHFAGTEVEEAYSQKDVSDEYDTQFDCLQCSVECATCTDGAPCVVTYDIVARGLPLGALAFCITCTVFVGGAVYRYRKRKVIASATWPLLEKMVLGAIMIYCSVIIRYFHPSFHLCLAEPWFRELGFVFFYCGVILKLYKVVTEFRTRKAHCVYVRDKDLVKYHVGIILITLGFMAAWTSVTMDLHRIGTTVELLMTRVHNDTNMKYRICRMPWWDFVAEGLEMLILFWGIYLSYLARNSKTLYMERKLLTAAICVELIVSGCLYVIRHIIWYDVHPDVIYLLYFSRSQLTITVNMCIIFGGKMWYIFRPQDDPFRKNQQHGQTGRSAEMEKLNDGIFAGDLELNQIPLADMDHGEIRMELRRLYSQMQVLKTKAMRKDNPHISKKKGGRKMHAPHRRWADAQAEKACKKMRRHPKYDEETTAAKSPEESSASQENNPTVYEDEAPYTSPLHAAFAGVAQNSAISRKAGLNLAMNYGHVTNL
ncbi:putative G-protein coupled receptor 158 [Hypsibius exemplaris]|uniref:G-protein coupled receptor 158 n=1 Tax=Hypsibius exemplaris TaxID=2072580 RepID=A0A1W0WZU4_HYPEX|nr:putative G-protein coupled receptor 158 [Hypsibius exemplaris]